MCALIDKLWESDDPYLKWLKESKGLSKTTIYHYNSYYKHFKNIAEINQQSIQSFIQKHKNNSVVRSFVKSFLDYAELQGLGIEFEMPKRKTGKKKQRIIKTYSPDQIRSVRKECYRKKYTYGLLFDFLYYGALRRGEIKTIRINSFDWIRFFEDPTKSCELIVEGKGKKQRPVLIDSKVMFRLLKIFVKKKIVNPKMDSKHVGVILQNNDNLLFNNIYEWKVWKIVNSNSMRKLGIPMRPHEIRHLRATELQDKGVSLRDIQHYLGHASPMITETYLHTTQKTSLNHVREILDG